MSRSFFKKHMAKNNPHGTPTSYTHIVSAAHSFLSLPQISLSPRAKRFKAKHCKTREHQGLGGRTVCVHNSQGVVTPRFSWSQKFLTGTHPHIRAQSGRALGQLSYTQALFRLEATMPSPARAIRTSTPRKQGVADSNDPAAGTIEKKSSEKKKLCEIYHDSPHELDTCL